MLHEEIHRLPERLRGPIVLCDLEGLTHESAARQLGWPVGTVKSRHHRGREQLRGRLLRRGVAPELGLMGMALPSDLLNGTLAPTLVEATTRAAIQFTRFRSILVGTASTLAQEVVRSMVLSNCIRLASVGLLLGVSASGIGRITEKPTVQMALAEEKPRAVPPIEPTATKEQSGKRDGVIEGRGVLASIPSRAIISPASGSIERINVSDGAEVKRGDLLFQIDPSSLRDELEDQKITCLEAESAAEIAREERALAEISVTEYLEGISKQAEVDLMLESVRTEMIRKQSEERLTRIRRAAERIQQMTGKIAGDALKPSDILSQLDIEERRDTAEVAFKSSAFLKEAAESRQRTFERYTKPKKIKELLTDVTRARNKEMLGLRIAENQREKQVQLEPGIGPGLKADENLKLGSIHPVSGEMHVNARIAQAEFGRLKSGQKVRIKIDAFPDDRLVGVLEELPARIAGTSREEAEVVTVPITVIQTPTGVQPGMKASVEIEAK